MSLFRNRRLSVDQLHAILRSLPQAKAPADLEDKLDHVIAEHSDHIPHVLGTLPLISAPDDFDARLMNAIRTQQRPSAPIPHWGISDPVAVNWFTHMTGWIAGAAVAVGLAFFIHSVDNSVRPVARQSQAPVAAVASNSGEHVAPPSWQAPATTPQAPTGEPAIAAVPRVEPQSGYRDEPATPEVTVTHQAEGPVSAPEPLRAKSVPVKPPVRIGDDTDMLHVKNNGFTGQQHSSVNAVTHETEVNHGTIAPPRENPEATPTPAKPDTSVAQAPATPSDSNDVSAQSGMGQVDTGRERIGQGADRSKP